MEIQYFIQTLFEQSTINGFKKSIKHENEKFEFTCKITKLEKEINSLRKQKLYLQEELALLEKSTKKRLELRLKVLKDDSDAITKTNLQLKRQIEAILSNKENQQR